MSYSRTTIPTLTRPKLSEEPGFISVELGLLENIDLPRRTPGLLAFLYIDRNWESVIKILLCDDLAHSFLENRPFSGRANRIAYHVFPAINGPGAPATELRNQLQLHARLTENYSVSQRKPGD